MNRPAKHTAPTKTQQRRRENGGQKPEIEEKAPPYSKIAETLMEITDRSINLARLYAERLQTDDGYQIIDPRTCLATFQELARRAVADPTPILKEQLSLWVDLTELWHNAVSRTLFSAPSKPVIEPARQDKRFKNDVWMENPYFDCLKQSYLLLSRCAESSVRNIEGVEPHILHKANFYTRQFISMCSPTNFVATNPIVIEAAMKSAGENLINGLRNLMEDLERGRGRLSIKMSDLDAFQFGQNIANSPGKVVFQNDLIQLIQYSPTTPKVHRRPLLIVPPWINKFYILDLKPKNSFVKWCVDQGHTVFVISWVNPGPEFADKNFADYLLEGPLAALDAIKLATGETDVNALGYCIGGTLIASTLAYMTARNDRRIASATFLTTLLDFSDVGDISVFIDEDQLKLADEHMERLGYLEGHHMADAFNMMRENDLIWFFVINNYLLGRDPSAFDLLYWNSNSTRMPAAMQSYYLRNMYHRNVLSNAGGITLDNVPIDLKRIGVPAYFLSTREDHIAPWRTTYAGTHLLSGPVRFVLGASGHVAGVINPPSANKYGYWTNEAAAAEAEEWLTGAKHQDGSWWGDWTKWVAGYGGGQVSARRPGHGGLPAIEDAPGSYVTVRPAYAS